MLTRDGWTQTWNGENRLIQAVKGSAKLQFAYDYKGRRVEKKVYDGESLTKHTRFVYDGYKLVEELDALNNNATLRKYTWQPESVGLDVPLSVYDAAANTTYFYTTDANKNVSDLTDSTGTVVAHYEYSPFGVQTKAAEAYAEMNPFRFSSEYFDSETGLVYYNYRYYSPNLGRWLSRDPIQEQGGVNMYMYCLNNALNNVDLLGLAVYVTIYTRDPKNQITSAAKKQAEAILRDAFNRTCPGSGDPNNLKFIWSPTTASDEDLGLGIIRGSNGDSYVYTRLNINNSISLLGYGNDYRGVINVEKIKQQRTGAGVDDAIGGAIAHEVFYHGVGGNYGHSGENPNQVDHSQPKLGPNDRFSDKAARTIHNKMK